MSLLANLMEAQGTSTLVIGTVRDIMARVRAPRAVFVDHPVGRTFGREWAVRRQRQILADALRCTPLFKKSGRIIDLPDKWKDRPGSSWKKAVESEILNFKE